MHALSAEDLLRLQLVYRDFELLRVGCGAGLLRADLQRLRVKLAAAIVHTIGASSRLLQVYCCSFDHIELLLLVLRAIGRVVEIVGVANHCTDRDLLLLAGVILLTVLILVCTELGHSVIDGIE